MVMSVRRGGGVSESPADGAHLALYAVFDIVGQIAEEVDAGLCFQILDAHGVIRQLVVSMIYIGVREPHADRLVISFSVDHLLHENGSKEILGDNQFVLNTLQDIFFFVNGTTLTYVHGVCVIEFESVQVVLHLDPKPFILMVGMTSIEDAILWLHIGEVESLRVGI